MRPIIALFWVYCRSWFNFEVGCLFLVIPEMVIIVSYILVILISSLSSLRGSSLPLLDCLPTAESVLYLRIWNVLSHLHSPQLILLSLLDVLEYTLSGRAPSRWASTSVMDLAFVLRQQGCSQCQGFSFRAFCLAVWPSLQASWQWKTRWLRSMASRCTARHWIKWLIWWWPTAQILLSPWNPLTRRPVSIEPNLWLRPRPWRDRCRTRGLLRTRAITLPLPRRR